MARAGTTTARRYAEAAFEIAERDGTTERWLAELDRIAAAVADDERRAARSRTRTCRSRSAMRLSARFSRTACCRRSTTWSAWSQRRRRLESIADIAGQFRRLYNLKRGHRRGRGTSAAKLDEREVDALRTRLEKMTGGRVELSLTVDPSLLGGIQVRLGDLLMDGSVRGRLERLRARSSAAPWRPEHQAHNTTQRHARTNSGSD